MRNYQAGLKPKKPLPLEVVASSLLARCQSASGLPACVLVPAADRPEDTSHIIQARPRVEQRQPGTQIWSLVSPMKLRCHSGQMGLQITRLPRTRTRPSVGVPPLAETDWRTGVKAPRLLTTINWLLHARRRFWRCLWLKLDLLQKRH